MYYETLPAIKPSNNELPDRSDEEYENKNILRIHVYDKNYTPDPEILHLKDLMASGDVTVEIADDSPGKGKIKASDVLGFISQENQRSYQVSCPQFDIWDKFLQCYRFFFKWNVDLRRFYREYTIFDSFAK